MEVNQMHNQSNFHLDYLQDHKLANYTLRTQDQ